MPKTIQLFATCLVEAIRPAIGLAAVRVLEHVGFSVDVPEGQTCCGQPAFNAGVWDDARAMARYTLDVLDRTEAPVVVPSGSCADMIVHRYPELLAADRHYGSKASHLATRVFEFSQFVDRHQADDPGDNDSRTLTYHPSCHLLRGLKVSEAPLRLLDRVAGSRCVSLPGADECCGFGGLFAVKMSEISSAMLERKLDHITESGADTVVACDAGCLLQIEGGIRRRGLDVSVCHLAEILAGKA